MEHPSTVQAVILAAGQGTRMRSSLPKVLHPILGRPMLHYSIQNAERICGMKPVVEMMFTSSCSLSM